MNQNLLANSRDRPPTGDRGARAHGRWGVANALLCARRHVTVARLDFVNAEERNRYRTTRRVWLVVLWRVLYNECKIPTHTYGHDYGNAGRRSRNAADLPATRHYTARGTAGGSALCACRYVATLVCERIYFYFLFSPPARPFPIHACVFRT